MKKKNNTVFKLLSLLMIAASESVICFAFNSATTSTIHRATTGTPSLSITSIHHHHHHHHHHIYQHVQKTSSQRNAIQNNNNNNNNNDETTATTTTTTATTTANATTTRRNMFQKLIVSSTAFALLAGESSLSSASAAAEKEPTIWKSGKEPIIQGKKPRDKNDTSGTRKDGEFLRSLSQCKVSKVNMCLISHGHICIYIDIDDTYHSLRVFKILHFVIFLHPSIHPSIHPHFLLFIRTNVKARMVQMDLQRRRKNVCRNVKIYVAKHMNNVLLVLFHEYNKQTASTVIQIK
jgi:hypothetical protein